jgi:N6-L-threonylcarbamoyladenine synthase
LISPPHLVKGSPNSQIGAAAISAVKKCIAYCSQIKFHVILVVACALFMFEKNTTSSFLRKTLWFTKIIFMMIGWLLLKQAHSFSWTSRSPRLFAASSCLQMSDSGVAAATSADEKRLRKQKAKAKRSQFIGMAKAVDRGQFSVTYNPGGPDGISFTAKSGLPSLANHFVVLGVETSCDDTGAAVVSSEGKILGEALASQAEIHEEYGGIVPGLAKSAHEENLDRVIELALKRAEMSLAEIDAIGVTIGPGLEICLRVGSNKARELAIEHNKPFVGIHHLEAHILMARLEQPDLEFPFLALLVSGGHCQLLKCLGIGRYDIIGGTLDDSLGEAFDKTARLLGLKTGGGGGPALESLAREGDPQSIDLTIPLRQRKDCDFSYAGLKTNVRRAAEQLMKERGLDSVDALSREDKANIAASFQNIAIKHVEMRLKRAMEMMEDDGIQSLALVGGVAANKELRGRLQSMCEERDWRLFVPPGRLCTDQGAMSAWAAIERLRLGSSDDPKDQEVYARFPFSNNNQA